MDETKKRWTRAEILLFALLVGFLVPLEVLCAQLAYETIGEVTRILYFLAIVLNLLFIVLAIRYRTIAALGVIVLALAIIPYQLLLGHRLLRVQAEAGRLATYAYEERTATGEFPRDLADYEFHDPKMEKYIQAYQVDEDNGALTLFYRVGTENTSHYYSSELGWGYYPD